MNEVCIIGAGISGLILAKNLSDAVVLEKSRGVGGRIASRRLGPYSLNHGPENIHDPLSKKVIEDPHAWMKDAADGLNILRSWEVARLEVSPGSIKVLSSSGESIEAKRIILTAPAPQAQAILERSGITADFLSQVRYTSIIQFMFLAESNVCLKDLEEHMIRKRSKDLEQNLSLHLYEMRSSCLKDFLEMDKEEIKKFCLSKIPSGVHDCHAHRWKYAEVETPIDHKYQFAFQEKNIFLAGDYFGKDGIESSLGSTASLLDKL